MCRQQIQRVRFLNLQRKGRTSFSNCIILEITALSLWRILKMRGKFNYLVVKLHIKFNGKTAILQNFTTFYKLFRIF